MAIKTDLQKIEQIKKDIHTSIKNKEVNIPNDTPFEDYPSKIDSITGGSSGYSYNCLCKTHYHQMSAHYH